LPGAVRARPMLEQFKHCWRDAVTSARCFREKTINLNLGLLLRGATVTSLRFPVAATNSGTCG